MNTVAIRALVRNDLRLYLTDRRAVIIGMLVPIMLAAFFGYIFGGAGSGDREAGKVPIAVVDEDNSTVSRAIATDLAEDAGCAAADARARPPRRCARASAMRLRSSPRASATRASPPCSVVATSPRSSCWSTRARPSARGWCRALLTQYSMQDFSREAFNGLSGKKAGG